YASAMAEGDFNGDGRLDLAVSNGGPSPNVSVLLGQGDGNFRAAPSVGAGGRGPFAVAVGDFNGHGKLWSGGAPKLSQWPTTRPIHVVEGVEAGRRPGIRGLVR